MSADSIPFGIMGVGGYIAPRHLEAIRATGHHVAVACDPSDSVGVLDRFSLETEFTTDELAFAQMLRRRTEGSKVRYIAICTPNHLHFAHCRLALEAGADVVCEKPLVLGRAELDQLALLEQRTGRRVHTVLQLRVHDELVALRSRLAQGPARKHEVTLTYVAGRGPWYHASWKGDVGKSGGVAANIGIHLFDLLLWLFGPVERAKVYLSDPQRMSGMLELERATVRWFVSVSSADAAGPPGVRVTEREITVDGEPCEFSDGFGELHTRVYEELLAGRGPGLEEARASIELTERLRSMPLSVLDGEAHPLVRRHVSPVRR
jgi:UDP-N-acetyl-2-amino-2-deoxyglucuronate dehydrogenase